MEAGCRDIFLQRPSKDIDVVVVGSGIDLAQKVADRLGKKAKLECVKNFGTAQVNPTNIEVEFVGARGSRINGIGKPIVESGTLEDDQNRRDFTINALALCLKQEPFWRPVGDF